MHLSFSTLKSRQRSERSDYSEYLSIRIHRALSWLQQAENYRGDSDSELIFLWIAFNAAYANEIIGHKKPTTTGSYIEFITKLCKLDTNKILEHLTWSEFPSSIRVLLRNKYVYQPFWDYKNGVITEEEWSRRFKASQDRAAKALSRGDTAHVLSIVLSRIYTLRNQIIHGGATWNSSVNRDQVKDGVRILKMLVPNLIQIMMDNSNELWGQPYYHPLTDE